MAPPPPPRIQPEAWVEIDVGLALAGWVVQDRDEMNLSIARSGTVREFKPKPGHGFVGYLLFVEGKAVGVLEDNPAGNILIGVEPQIANHASGLPGGLNPPIEPLPFLYLNTGVITNLTTPLDPEPRSRRIVDFPRTETLADWLAAATPDTWVKDNGANTAADNTKPSHTPPYQNRGRTSRSHV